MFFLDAYEMGPSALVTPYNGYFHLVPRLTARLALAFDPRWMPAIYQAVAFGIWLAVILALFSPRIRLPAKPALALAFVLVPHTGEVFISLTNLQWPLAVGLVLLILADDPATPGQWGADLVALLICGLTGPFSIFLWPLFLVRAFLRRTRASVLLALVDAVVAGLQVATIYRYRFLFAVKAPPNPAGVLSRPGRPPLRDVFRRLRPGGIPGRRGLDRRGARSDDARRVGRDLGPLVVKDGEDAGGSLALPRGAGRGEIPPQGLRDLRAGRRRPVLLPAPCDPRLDPRDLLRAAAGWRRSAVAAALLAAFAVNLPHFRGPPLANYAWAEHVQPIREGKGFKIPINPPGWFVQSPGRDSRRE